MNCTLQLRKDNDNYQIREFNGCFRELRSQATCNIEYFQPNKNQLHKKYHELFQILHDAIDFRIHENVEYLFKIVHLYDISPDIPANGYRSFLRVLHKYMLHLLQLTRYVIVNRSSYLFRAEHYYKELHAYINAFVQLIECVHVLKKLSFLCEKGDQFPRMSEILSSNSMAHSLLEQVQAMNSEPFFGRCLGFQYSPSIVSAIRTICWMMASYSEAYQHKSLTMKVTSSLVNASRYFVNPELRAKKIAKITGDVDLKFCTEFWSLNENDYLTKFHQIVSPKMSLDRLITIPAVPLYIKCSPPEAKGQKLEGSAAETGRVKVMPPCSSSGASTVTVRLISRSLRRGQEKWKRDAKLSSHHPAHHHHHHQHGGHAEVNPCSDDHTGQPLQPLSESLVFHCHGGGFIAQSSASHLVYLRQWANQFDAPILSVDYSLAPEHKFPRAIEDIFFSYCWALNNAHLLGWTGEKVCFVGDSAGGNMITSTILRCIMTGVRKPDHMVGVYTAMRIQYIPSASRMLTVCDPMLPLGILEKCLAAYSGVHKEKKSNSKKTPPTSLSTSVNASPTSPTSTPPGGVDTSRPSTSDSDSDNDPTVNFDVKRHRSSESADSGIEALDSCDVQKMNTRNLQESLSDLEMSDDVILRGCASLPDVITCQSKDTYKPKKTDTKKSKINEFNDKCVNNMFMTPILAPDHILKQMCPVTMVSCQMDSMLDDSIEFVKHLRKLRGHHPDASAAGQSGPKCAANGRVSRGLADICDDAPVNCSRANAGDGVEEAESRVVEGGSSVPRKISADAIANASGKHECCHRCRGDHNPINTSADLCPNEPSFTSTQPTTMDTTDAPFTNEPCPATKTPCSCSTPPPAVINELSSCSTSLPAVINEPSSCSTPSPAVISEPSSCSTPPPAVINEPSSCSTPSPAVIKEPSSCPCSTPPPPGVVDYVDHLVMVDGDLPHGFLNFSLMNSESYRASARVANIIAEKLKGGTSTPMDCRVNTTQQGDWTILD